ncbi:MAG: efflux RND transporter permease subunit, partial [Campylobacteraceae bacterium]|nr:efflux RND transporter permease subunit [Campylobacteraceae bacterium]
MRKVAEQIPFTFQQLQKYEKGVPRMKAAIDGTMEVLPAVFSAIVTTVVAFSTFLFLDGRLGDFFREMAI